MRNLRCVQHTRLDVEASAPLTASTWDTVQDAVLYTLGPSKDSPVVELRRSNSAGSDSPLQSSLVASWDAVSPRPDLVLDKIVSLHHLVARETACIIFAGGDIVIVRLDPQPGEEKIEIVGSVDAGISAAAWTPDEDLLAIATCAGTILFMTADFDNVASATFRPEDARLSKQVSVGWGKTETQFKGKRARALRDPTLPEHVDEGKLSLYDLGDVNISWRGDGAFVAINTIEGGARRMIRVYTREGSLDSVSEPIDGLEGALSWKPSGNLIAAVQRSSDQSRVIFFERNGLRHGEFDLRLDQSAGPLASGGISLSWNIDSSVLAVALQDRIQLWTMGNYHYYSKREIATSSAGATSLPATVRWHPEEALRLLLQDTMPSVPEPIPESGGPQIHGYRDSLHTVQLVFALANGSSLPPCDFGNVIVVDGQITRITPLRAANIPPPMALHEIETKTKVLDAAFNKNDTRFALLHNDGVTEYLCENDRLPVPEPREANTIEIPTSRDVVALQLCYNKEDGLFILLSDLKARSLKVYAAKSAQVYHETVLSGPMRRPVLLFPSVGHESLYLLANGLERITKEPLDPFEDKIASTPAVMGQPTPWIQALRDKAFGLTASGLLYVNEKLLMKGCTSFLVTENHLVVTTRDHLLKFVHLANDVEDLEVPPDQPETDERCRSIERGAKLVAIMPTTFAVVLQMPRGNLETIFPRALVLAGIRRAIEQRDYRKAFLVCRNQRVDMNIIHDHSPKQFLEDVPRFIEQLNKLEHIDLFISQLRDEDVSKTMYKETTPKQDQGGTDVRLANDDISDQTPTGKVNRICDVFLDAFKTRSSTNLQNIVTTHLCRVPPDIESGLHLISRLQEEQPDDVEGAVEHMCFLADVNKIFDVALGMYKLDLALLVAQQSQKDPREYLPYLQRLQDMPELRRQFHIDDDLGRREKALEHLHTMRSHTEVNAYMTKHDLYRSAMDLYKHDPGNHAQVLRLYADHMVSRNRFADAAIAYESLSDYQAASDAFRGASMWQECLSSATLAPLSQEAMTELALSLAESLEESKDFAAAGRIRLDYLSQIEDAAKSYCKGYHFAEAIRLAGLHGRPNLIPDIVDPALGEGFASLTELLADCKGQLGAQVPRLRELRTIKKQDPLAFFEGAAQEDIPDNISLAPSATSTTGSTLLTRYTGRTSSTIATGTSRKTSKNRRREERKRARGKKGSVYEEEYLVNSIGRLIARINDTTEDVQNTVRAMLRRGMWEQAKVLETSMSDVVDACKACVDEVWEVKTRGAPGQDETDGEVGERPMGGDGVLWDSLEEARHSREPPTLKKYARSTLLT